MRFPKFVYFHLDVSISITKVPEKLNSDVALVRVLELESVEQLVVVGQLVHELQVLVRLLGRERPPEVTHLVPLLLRLDQLSKVAGSDVVLQTKQSFFLCAVNLQNVLSCFLRYQVLAACERMAFASAF